MLMTANPCADAERWENEQDLRAAQAEALEIEAGQTVLAEMEDMTTQKWSSGQISGPRYFTPEVIFFDAMDSDDDTASAFATLMATPAAAEVLKCAGLAHAKRYWRDIAGIPGVDNDAV